MSAGNKPGFFKRIFSKKKTKDACAEDACKPTQSPPVKTPKPVPVDYIRKYRAVKSQPKFDLMQGVMSNSAKKQQKLKYIHEKNQLYDKPQKAGQEPIYLAKKMTGFRKLGYRLGLVKPKSKMDK